MREYCLFSGNGLSAKLPAVTWEGQEKPPGVFASAKPRPLVAGAATAEILIWLSVRGIGAEDIEFMRHVFVLDERQEIEFRTRWF